MQRSAVGFTRFAWAVLAYLLFVIVFGALVRITHSGAGCGSHWPTCNGEVIPIDPTMETIIEFTHRVTSGVLGPAGLALVVWAARVHGWGRVTQAAIVTVAFIVLEGLIGAKLVLEELVADDDSVARAVVISLHLVNTLVLTAAASLTAWWSVDRRPRVRNAWVLRGALALLVLTCMSGAVTALGDTLFPVPERAVLETRALWAHAQADLSPASHFLQRLRIVHPLLAVCAAGAVYASAAWSRARAIDPRTRRLAQALQYGVVAQVVLGIANIGLAAPEWMQLVHLLAAQLIWILAVLTTVSWGADR